MRMSADDIKKYPQFYEYIRFKMPEVRSVGAIVNSIKKLAGKTPRATITEALKWGQGPLIKIVKNLASSTGERVNGQYAWGSSELQIDEDRVTSFEKQKGHIGFNKKGQHVYLVGVTVLHELTHWADAQDGVDDQPYEEGDQYEKDVYGKFVR